MTKNESLVPAILSILLLLSLAGNVALGMQAVSTSAAPKEKDPVWLSSQSTVRGTLSGEARLAAGELAPEYDYAFGMRKNMQLSKENCVMDECFLNMDMQLPVGTLPTEYATALEDLALKEREVADRLDAEKSIRKSSPLVKIHSSQGLRVAALSFLEAKYGLTPKASLGVNLSGTQGDPTASCKQVLDQVIVLQNGYDTELARTDIMSRPDLEYVYRQLATQTKSVYLPLAQSCAQ